MNTKTFLLFYCCINFIFIKTEGQTPTYLHNKHYTVKNGLPNNLVKTVSQDDKGFIWIATMNGVVRFDGTNFTTFSSSNSQERSLSTSKIRELYIDNDQLIWVYNFNGVVDVIDSELLISTKDIQPFKKKLIDSCLFRFKENPVEAIHSDLKGNWFAGNSAGELLLFDSSNLKMINVFASSKFINYEINGYAADERGVLWLSTPLGILESNEQWDEFYLHQPNKNQLYNPPHSTRKPVIHLNDELIFFSYQDQPWFFNKFSKSFRKLNMPEVPVYVKNWGIKYAALTKNGNVIFDYQSKIFMVNESGQINIIWEYPDERPKKIKELFVDNTNVLWVGTDTGGLYKIDLNTPAFENEPYQTNYLIDLLKSEFNINDINIPTSFYSEKWSYNLRYTYFRGHLLISDKPETADYIKDIYHLSKNNLHTIPSLDCEQKALIGIASTKDSIFALEQNGYLQARSHIDSLPRRYLAIPLDQNGYLEQSTSTLTSKLKLIDLAASQNELFAISTNNQLFQLDSERQLSIYLLNNPSDPANSIYFEEQHPDYLWIGLLGGGLLKWNIDKTAVEKIYTTSEGLSDNNVTAIIGDDKGRLWISTFNGVSLFDPSTERFEIFRENVGIRGLEFNRKHCLKLPDGRISFGSLTASVAFQPMSYAIDKSDPPLVLSSMKIKKGVSSRKKDLQQAINKNDHLQLNYDENSFSLDAFIPQYNNSKPNKIRYKISGLEDLWNIKSENNPIQIDRIPAGNYQLILNASNSAGHWSSMTKTIDIQVKNPPWLQWWALIAYLGILVLLVYAFAKRYQVNLLRKQQAVFDHNEAVRLKELDQIKTNFFSNVTHEFRTPLTLIISPLEKLLKDTGQSGPTLKSEQILQNNYKHANKLLSLVNQLLDISKLEAGKVSKKQALGELTIFVKDIIAQFKDLASAKRIDLSYDSDIQGCFLFDKSSFEKVVVNLISNAIKFTPQGGSVNVRMTSEIQADKYRLITCQVIDNGIGVAVDKVDKLFDRFYQVNNDDKSSFEGTGIGLSIVKEYTELLNGTVEVNSEAGVGSTFTIKIPMQKVEDTLESVSIISNSVEPRKVQQANVNKKTILVIEDNLELLEFISQSLEEYHYNILTASEGTIAWKIIMEELPDLVISDVMLPGISGLELVEKSKANLLSSHIPIILLTAKASQEAKEEGLISGADAYLTKPFHLDELRILIENQFTQQQRAQSYFYRQLAEPDTPAEPVFHNAFLEKLNDAINLNLADPDFGVNDLAAALKISKSTLNRKLKVLMDISSSDYIKHFRLKSSLVFLKTNMQVAEIAYLVGFESASYFSLCFKEFYGKNPSDYRKKQL